MRVSLNPFLYHAIHPTYMNADEAWNEFQRDSVRKSGATISGKLDTLAQLLSEVGADTSRTAETVIPQLEGDQSAIDAANEQAGAPDMGAPDMGAPDAGLPPVPEGTGAPDMGAPDAPPVPGAEDMGAPAPDTPPAPPEEIPMDDMGEPQTPEGTPFKGGMAPTADMEEAPEGPDMNPAGPDMSDFGNFSYSPDDALNDFIMSITDVAHEALDAGDTARVASITSFVDGVKRLWAEYMGGTGMPVGLDADQSMGLPAPEEGPEATPGAGEIPEGEGEAPVEETASEDDAPAEDGEKDDKEDDDTKDDDDVKKSCSDAEKSEEEEDTEKSEDAEGEDIAESEADKADGKTCIEPGEDGIKKSVSMMERMRIMDDVMNDRNATYTGDCIPAYRENATIKSESRVDMKAVLEEFRSGAVVKSSRAPVESAMGDFRNDTEAATKRVSAVSEIFDNMRKSQSVPEKDLDEVESEMEMLTTKLRARRDFQ